MATSSTRATVQAAQTGVRDPLAEFIVYLKVILPEAAIHIVNIRRHWDPTKKTTWIVSPGSFHAQRGDLVYWTAGSGGAELSFKTNVIGTPALSVPCDGTSMGSIQANLPGTPPTQHRYEVHVGTDLVVTDDGSAPTIIVDD